MCNPRKRKSIPNDHPSLQAAVSPLPIRSRRSRVWLQQCPRRGHPWPPKSSPPMKQFLTLLRMLPSMVMLTLILLFEWLTGHEL